MSFENVPTLSNRSERLPCVLVVDASSSMSGTPIKELNDGLVLLEQDLKRDEEASRRVRVMVVQVSDESARKIVDWVDAEHFSAPKLSPSGRTPLGDGVRIALEEIKAELQRLKDENIARKVPWVWIFTDGSPTDGGWQNVAAECSSEHAANRILVYPIAVGSEANTENLGMFSKDRHVHQIPPESFKQFFEFLSASARAGSAKAGEVVVTPLFPQVSG